jgi:hypothetical protein
VIAGRKPVAFLAVALAIREEAGLPIIGRDLHDRHRRQHGPAHTGTADGEIEKVRKWLGVAEKLGRTRNQRVGKGKCGPATLSCIASSARHPAANGSRRVPLSLCNWLALNGWPV